MHLCSICSWLRREFAEALVRFYLMFCRPKSLTIVPQGDTMSFPAIKVGGTTPFTVVPRNAEGVVVPDTGITATSDNTAVATVTVNTDGSGGIVTAVALGTYNITATDGTITSPPLDGSVVDTTVATLTITPS